MKQNLINKELGLNSFTKKWLLKNKNQELSYKKLAMMWFLIFLGYFVFVVQWYSIGNFSGGWGQAFFPNGQSPLVQSVPNWMITFGRAIGSILAGYWIAKFGHKYAVIFVLSLMVIAFPFVIVAQNQGWNHLSVAGDASLTSDGNYQIAVAGFSLFVIFRIFLAVGGTTLISYTNSIISKMPTDKKVKHMTLNQFAFNGGALVANIFFVIPGVLAIVKKDVVWTSIVSSFIVLTMIILIFYFLFACEVVPRQTKNFNEKKSYTLLDSFKDKEGWMLYLIYIVWLVSVVFVNSSTMRNFIEQSPSNILALVNDNITHKNELTSIPTSMSNSKSYYWVWPSYICAFVLGFIVSIFTITKFSKTIFKRKWFILTMFIFGYMFLLASILCGYFGGYANPSALAFFLIFSFMSGIFLWGVQPVIFTIPQQQQKSNPQYMGVIAGVIWGVGYFGYTVIDASLSSIVTYVNPISDLGLKIQQLSQASILPIVSQSIKTTETTGFILMMVILWLIFTTVVPICMFLPDSGYKKDGVFYKFSKTWNPFKIDNLNFEKPEYLIDNQ